MKSQHQQRVERFMGLAGQHVPAEVTMPDAETRLLRARLIFEEALETIEALGFSVYLAAGSEYVAKGTARFEIGDPPDLAGIVDGCADLSVVTIGTLSACGVPDLPVVQEVDAANLRKFDGDAHRDQETGKWIKPSNFVPPDVEGLLRRLGREDK